MTDLNMLLSCFRDNMSDLTQLNAAEIERALRWTSNLNAGVAKNVILFVGDGMSVQTQTAARQTSFF